MTTTCYSADGETFSHESLGALIDNDELQVGDTYYEADSEPLKAGDCLRPHVIENLLECMDERLWDLANAMPDNPFSGVSPEARNELRSLVLAWAERHVDLTRYWHIVGEPRQCVLTPDDLADGSEGCAA
jgi:hypothetical protein